MVLPAFFLCEEFGPFLLVQEGCHVDVLHPTARVALVEEDLIGNADRFRSTAPFRFLAQAFFPGDR